MDTPPLFHARNTDAPARAADATTAPAPRAAAASSVSVQVERLLLDGFDLPPGGARQVQAAFRVELARLLSADDLPSGLRAGGARRDLPGAPLNISEWVDPVDLGNKVARALYAGMQR